MGEDTISQEYYESGAYDHLQEPMDFHDEMSQRPGIFVDYYLQGITELENDYGDKAYRQYDVWFMALDKALAEAEKVFWSN